MEIKVDKTLVRKCRARGDAIAKAWTHNGVLTNPAYSKGRVTQKQSAAINTYGIIAEVALHLYLGLDPEPHFNRSATESDGGVDLNVNGKTIDVKASDNPFATRLMWPVKLIHKLPACADVLVMAVVAPAPAEDGSRTVRFRGWVTKEEFISQHWKAKGINGVVDGSPYMNEKSLYSMEQLVQHLGHVKATKESANV